MQFGKRVKVKKYSYKSEKIRKRLIYFIISGILLLGALYQQLGISFNAPKLGRMGKLVSVDHTRMHLYEEGTGELPIVFASSIGATVPYVETYPLHSELSKSHPVKVYDKPGYGWSDCTSSARTIDNIVKEIHTVLHKDYEDDDDFEPFIYVAQGTGSLEALRYAQLYPDDVAGIVLIDGASPTFCVDFNNIMILESFFTNGLRNVGLLRLTKSTHFTTNSLSMNPEVTGHLKELNIGLGLEKSWNHDMISEKLKIKENAQAIIDGGTLKDLPIRVITSTANPYGNWNRTQKELLTFSTDTAQTTIEGSCDYIEQKDVPTILEVINDLTTYIHEKNDE